MNSIVISLGGSVLISDDIDISFFEDLASLLKKLTEKYKIYLIIGGGN
jgi:uridylate kinase